MQVSNQIHVQVSNLTCSPYSSKKALQCNRKRWNQRARTLGTRNSSPVASASSGSSSSRDIRTRTLAQCRHGFTLSRRELGLMRYLHFILVSSLYGRRNRFQQSAKQRLWAESPLCGRPYAETVLDCSLFLSCPVLL